ncbi:hypothetical protein [Nocardia callitridis]|uniref:WXG100 family type VII secretion target n=1 Tax=Nocardia callitridis TaxID=648753 RepID=A0ABP9KWE3_9NOCA
MADNLEADAELFRKAAQKSGHVRDRIDTVLSTLTTSLASRGAPWGDDKIGDQFANGANGYLAAVGKLSGGTTNMSITMNNFADGQTKSANLLERMDHSNGHGFQGHY